MQKEDDDESSEHEDWACFKADGIQIQFNLKEKLEKGKLENADEKTTDDDQSERFFIGESRPSS